MRKYGSTGFELHPRLKADTWSMGESSNSLLLLMNNALAPWLILVPKTDAHELHHLSASFRQDIREEVDLVCAALEQALRPHKLNVATLGNAVSQLHIHVVARYTNDVFWPGPVWGHEQRRDYQAEEVERLKGQLREDLGQAFALA
ncbi:HIT family protein [Thiorhodococcus mannitoliphagus]|uniref:HIT family protein n=1 Tax=Thiorhodococcus mannitoliphagus TaxID=329406 RepID=A0A6P1DV79_9GAMM|nr:HIT family protein [Thiorhodococcus mannitoliphagus]NEX21380.1 HIT family protein [Thiorhodococcus mannitoliphagus]